MLRGKGGSMTVLVKDKNDPDATPKKYDYGKLLSSKQRRSTKTKPDLIWQLAQRVKDAEAKEGRDVAVYMDVRVKVNGGEYHRLIDKEVDLASEEWHHFQHHDWILPSPESYHKN